MRSLVRHYELEVACRGPIDPVTSYLVDIKDVDKAVRAKALPIIQRACLAQSAAEAQEVLAQVTKALNSALHPKLESVRWRLSPYHSLEMTASPSTAATLPGAAALLRQRFDFAAA